MVSLSNQSGKGAVFKSTQGLPTHTGNTPRFSVDNWRVAATYRPANEGNGHSEGAMLLAIFSNSSLFIGSMSWAMST